MSRRLRLKNLVIAVAICAGLCWALREAYYWGLDLMYRRYGGVSVEMPDGSTKLAGHRDMHDVIGGYVTSNTLVQVIERRIAKTKGLPFSSDDPFFEGSPTRTEEKITYAGELLALTKHPRALELLRQLMQDPSFWVRHCAIHSLGRLGDQRAIPILLDALQSGQGGDVLTAFLYLGDPHAVPGLLDDLSDVNQGAVFESYLGIIERLTCESLDEFRARWANDIVNSQCAQAHKALREWWESNKTAVLDRYESSQPQGAEGGQSRFGRCP
jgi:hypothetical protein